MADQRCRHDLPAGQCDYCRPRPPDDPFAQPSALPRPGRRDDDDDDDDRPGPLFIASFTTECPICLDDVEEGDEARMFENEAHHAECVRAYLR
jgi:hypothetical protein